MSLLSYPLERLLSATSTNTSNLIFYGSIKFLFALVHTSVFLIGCLSLLIGIVLLILDFRDRGSMDTQLGKFSDRLVYFHSVRNCFTSFRVDESNLINLICCDLAGTLTLRK